MWPTVCYKAFSFLYTTDPICLSTYLMELWHEGEKQTEKWKKDSTVLLSVGSKHEVLIYVLLIFFSFFLWIWANNLFLLLIVGGTLLSELEYWADPVIFINLA